MTNQAVERTEIDQTVEPVITTSVDALSERTGDFRGLGGFPNPLRQPRKALGWVARVLVGVPTLLGLLAIAASVPGLNLLALGYLLGAEGEVARVGKLRRSLPSLPAAIRIGSNLLGTLACLLPVWLLADLSADARLIAPQGTTTRLWNAALVLVSVLVAIHVGLAWSLGGSLGCFFRPIRNARRARRLRAEDTTMRAECALREFLTAIRPWHHFWLGVRGFLGTWAWLALPTALFGLGWHSGVTWHRLLTLVAGASLVPLLAWVPFLQVRLAVEDRFSAMFEVRQVRELFRHAPLSWLAATIALYSLSIPLFLYSLRYRMGVPLHLGIWWDLTFVSILGAIPARAALGWAYHRASSRGPAWIGWIWLSRLLLACSLGLYVWLLFHATLTHESPPWQLEHHALVLPIPW